MAYLIGQLLVPLAIAAVFGGGLAGWSWHCIANRDRWAARDAERDRLRNELLTYVGHVTPVRGGDGVIQLGGAELESLHVRLDGANDHILALQRDLATREETAIQHQGRIAELEMALASAQTSVSHDGDADDRVAALETALRDAEARAADVDRRAARLEADLDAAAAPAAPGVDVAAMRWRIHQLETRLGAQEAHESIARIAAPAADVAPRPDLDDELNRRRWQTRYLDSRVRYLEGAAHAEQAVAPAQAVAAIATPVDEEGDNRRRWRQRYLEARVAWLEGRARDHGDARAGLVSEITARDERLRALESHPATPQADPARIATLQQRVAELEGALAASRAETTHGARRFADVEAERARDRARIAELEQRPVAAAPTAEVAADPEVGRLRWRSRYLDNRVRYLEQTLASAPLAAPQQAPAAPRDDSFTPLAPAGAEVRPVALPAPRDGARDDLRMIAGIGPRIESTLHSLGVYHFDQIAAWSPANIDWIERYLAFKGRIGREDWVAQARALARGEETDGKRRYLEGEHV